MTAAANKQLQIGDIIDIVHYNNKSRRDSVRRVRVKSMRRVGEFTLNLLEYIGMLPDQVGRDGLLMVIGVNMQGKYPVQYLLNEHPGMNPRPNALDWVYFDPDEPTD